jgi:exosome complex component RRP4
MTERRDVKAAAAEAIAEGEEAGESLGPYMKEEEGYEEAGEAPVSEDKLLKKDREFVIPGDEIIKSIDYLPGKNCFRDGDSIVAKRVGIVSVIGRVISVIPLSGVYVPRIGDMVIGEVVEIQSNNGWLVNVRAPINAYLPISGVREYIDTTRTELSRVYAIGDVIYAKVSNIAGSTTLHLSMQDPRCRKFRTGRVVRMSPVKVPRLIGKHGSMINLIKDYTGCRINVGQNGFIWLEGEMEELAIKAIKMIERESQSEGLTDRVNDMLKETRGPLPKAQPREAAAGTGEDYEEDAEPSSRRPAHEDFFDDDEEEV